MKKSKKPSQLLFNFLILILGLMLGLTLAKIDFKEPSYSYSSIVETKDDKLIEYSVQNCTCGKMEMDNALKKINSNQIQIIQGINNSIFQFSCKFSTFTFKEKEFEYITNFNIDQSDVITFDPKLDYVQPSDYKFMMIAFFNKYPKYKSYYNELLEDKLFKSDNNKEIAKDFYIEMKLE
jgi:hypothetical protein